MEKPQMQTTVPANEILEFIIPVKPLNTAKIIKQRQTTNTILDINV